MLFIIIFVLPAFLSKRNSETTWKKALTITMIILFATQEGLETPGGTLTMKLQRGRDARQKFLIKLLR